MLLVVDRGFRSFRYFGLDCGFVGWGGPCLYCDLSASSCNLS